MALTPPAQATGAAVSGLYAAVGATATVLAGRIQATGAALVIASAQYVNLDENSTQRLTALDAPVRP
ncbi:hypothetical protein BayCH28_25215 [Mycolicibacterium sp. CH28]|uniref:hypothetical protein n=1 Tax=Mycolicibacterium sp. CH28 TaxID=2512237 RepID=UPI001080D1A0|nr:hypothetical protein [Mycolicibacterium sp. CH28]TGD84692.1 hypothetical protein BayCH28_25215 [Mycolicibacterium sp. CH28]